MIFDQHQARKGPYMPADSSRKQEAVEPKRESTAPKRDFSFPKSMHLRKRGEFDRVFQHKHSGGDHVLVVYGMANGLDVSRLGLVVSKKVGKAHVRNRWKRLIREAFRLECRQWPCSLDLVVIPRQGVEPDFSAIRRSLCKLVKRVLRS
jgi:ribonuclease P protein component, eubacterial